MSKESRSPSPTEALQFSIFPDEQEKQIIQSLEKPNEVEVLIKDRIEISYEEFKRIYDMGLVLGVTVIRGDRPSVDVFIKPFTERSFQIAKPAENDAVSLSYENERGMIRPILHRQAKKSDVERIATLYAERKPKPESERNQTAVKPTPVAKSENLATSPLEEKESDFQERISLEQYRELLKNNRVISVESSTDATEVFRIVVTVQGPPTKLLRATQVQPIRTSEGLKLSVVDKNTQDTTDPFKTYVASGDDARSIAAAWEKWQKFQHREPVTKSTGANKLRNRQ